MAPRPEGRATEPLEAKAGIFPKSRPGPMEEAKDRDLREEAEDRDLREQALKALLQADFHGAANLWIQGLDREPKLAASLAQVALQFEWLTERRGILEKLDQMSSRQLPVATRRLLNQLRLDLALQLGAGKRIRRISRQQGTFREFVRISFPLPGHDPFATGHLPGPKERKDYRVGTKPPLFFEPDLWSSGKKSAILWGGFQIGQKEAARFVLETNGPALLAVDGKIVVVADPELGRPAGRLEILANLDSGSHTLLLLTRRPDHGLPWRTRLLVQDDTGTSLGVFPLPAMAEVEKNRFFSGFPRAFPAAPPLPAVGDNLLDELDRAAVEMERGNLTTAEARLEILAEKFPKNEAVTFYQVLCQKKLARWSRSARRHKTELNRYLGKIAADKRGSLLLRLLAARHLAAAGESRRSLALLQTAPGTTLLYKLVAAEWLHRYGLEQDKLDLLRQGNRIAPGFLPVAFELARALESDHRPLEALRIARRAFSQNRRHTKLRAWAVRRLAMIGQTAEALELCANPGLAAPSQAKDLCEAPAWIQGGQPEKAQEILRPVARDLPALAPVRKILISALDLMGFGKEADKERQELAQIEGTGPGALRGLVRDLDTNLEQLLESASRPLPISPFQRPNSAPNRLARPLPSMGQEVFPEIAKGADAVQLLDISIVDIDRTGRFREFYHGSIQPLTARGREEAGELRLPADGTLLRAFVRLSTGETLLPEQIQKSEETQVISFYGLAEEAVTDFSWRRPARPIEELDIQFVFGAQNDPLFLSRFCLATPPGSDPVEIKIQRSQNLQERRGYLAGRQLRCWERTLIAPLGEEPFMPDITDLAPGVRLLPRRDSSQFRRFLLRSLAGLASYDERFILEAYKIFQGADLDAAWIYRFVRDKIADGGAASSATDVLILKGGNPALRVALAKLLCQRAGIPAHLGWSLDSPTLGQNPTTGSGAGEAVLVVPRPGGARPWLWTFRSAYVGPEITDPIIRGEALLVDRQGQILVLPPPGDDSAPDRLDLQVELWIDLSGNARVHARLAIHDALAGNFRQLLVSSPDRASFAAGMAASFLPEMEIESVTLDGSSADAPALTLEIRGRIAHLLSSFPSVELQPVLLKGSLSNLTSLLQRRHPLEIEGFPSSEQLLVTVHLAPGLELGSAPEPLLVTSQFGLYSLDFQKDGQTLSLARTALFPPQTIPPSRYEEMAKIFRRIDRAENQGIEIRKSSEPSRTAWEQGESSP